jgi:hypothetical protein
MSHKLWLRSVYNVIHLRNYKICDVLLLIRNLRCVTSVVFSLVIASRNFVNGVTQHKILSVCLENRMTQGRKISVT